MKSLVHLNFFNNRQNHGLALGQTVEVVAGGVADFGFEVLPVALVLRNGGKQRIGDDLLRRFKHILGIADIDESAGNDVRTGKNFALVAEGHGDDHKTVLAKMLSVAEHHVAYVAHAKTVHKHCARGNAAYGGDAVDAHFDNAAKLRNENIFFIHSHGHGGGSVYFKVLVFAVERDEILRLRQRYHKLFFILAGVTGNVNLAVPLVNHLGAQAHKLVYHAPDALFVAGNRVCGNDYHITACDVYFAVIAHGHARQRRHRLALAAGGDHNGFALRQAVDGKDRRKAQAV